MSKLSNNNKNELVNQDHFSNEINQKKSEAQRLLNRKMTLLQRIFPSVEQKEAIKHTKITLAQESESDLEVRRMHNEFFKQALQATFDKVLTEGTESIQEGLTRKFTANKATLDKEIVKLTKEYFEEMEAFENEIFQIKSDRMRSRQLNMLDKRIDEFERTVNNLMKKYEDTHNKSVGDKN
ncbi:hypothetical protein GWK08_05580 [Leptobacterium flavescens]|uniref:Uncharacterized protein n=1 Tax=Leptobacterium flavescens TaxID=472055 RepID=A0A6P0UKG1_9FLAO|nr:hypothetical protein [Leptobacterium flavescens]NER12900.1 hypothetical protein [Leptobacterium flavescens]